MLLYIKGDIRHFKVAAVNKNGPGEFKSVTPCNVKNGNTIIFTSIFPNTNHKQAVFMWYKPIFLPTVIKCTIAWSISEIHNITQTLDWYMHCLRQFLENDWMD